jgi:hypothetical protein
MARGWGGGPPDIKGTLGTLLRTTLIQLSSLRDAARREIESRREWIGGGDIERQRTAVLAGLGAIIVELARAGELDLEDFPEVRQAIDDLQALDDEIAAAGPQPPARPASIGVWRPPMDDPEPAPADLPAPEGRPSRRRPGGSRIAFVSDELEDEEDLAEYMHRDDVPGDDGGESGS